VTDRDTFAAAALTGLLAGPGDKDFSADYWARHAYEAADAMLRERGRVTETMTKEKRAEVSAAPVSRQAETEVCGRATDIIARHAATLTDEEREAVKQAAIRVESLCQLGAQRMAATLRNLLERTKCST